MGYQCFVEGCPATHVSKHEVCTVSSKHDLSWALERVKSFDPSKGLMPYQEGMIAMAAEIERLRYENRPMLGVGLPSETSCTCPSGDGSLRWPCPVHPPSTARRCHCGKFAMQPGMALITDEHAHDHVFDGTPCDCEGEPACSTERRRE